MYHTSCEKPLFDQVVELSRNVLNVSNDEAEVACCVEALIRDKVGGEEMTLSRLLNENAMPETGGNNSRMMGNFESEWRDIYISEALFLPSRDYGIQHVLTDHRPLLKSNYPLHLMNKKQIETYNRAGDFSNLEGVMLQVQTFSYELYAMSITGQYFAPSYSDQLALQVLASEASEAIKRIRGEKKTILEYGLTKRELEVLELICVDPIRHTNEVVAQELNIGKRQVEKHLTNIYSKLGGVKRSGAIEIAKSKHIHIYGRYTAANT